MIGCLLFLILCVLVAAFFPMCALVVGAGGVLTVAVVADFFVRYGWVLFAVAIVVAIIAAVVQRPGRMPTAPYCGDCGAVRLEGARVCPQCGATLT